jgi:hypothetical protein
MTGLPFRPRFPSRRTMRRVRWFALAVVVFGPLAQGAWAVRVAPRLRLNATEVTPSSTRPTDGSGTPAERAGDYLAQRNPVVDRLLPEGAGGTHFVEKLDGNAGQAFPISAAIGLSVTADRGSWREAVELHERAHLLHEFLPDEVAAVLAVTPAARRGEYAAKNAHEHFGEMAFKAWEVVASPDNVCLMETPTERLRSNEALVPGTAGFVLWYLRFMPAPDEANGRQTLAGVAAELSAPARSQWDALWRALEARRLPDGHFPPWTYSSVRQFIELRRRGARADGGVLGNAASVALLPSLGVLTLAGR